MNKIAFWQFLIVWVSYFNNGVFRLQNPDLHVYLADGTSLVTCYQALNAQVADTQAHLPFYILVMAGFLNRT